MAMAPQADNRPRLQWAMIQTPPPTSPLDALKPAAGRVLEAALNRAVALDPDTRDALRALDGRRVELALKSPPLALRLRVDGERLVVGPVEKENEPDLSVRSTLGALLGQLPALLGARGDDAPPIGGMRISGDADLRSEEHTSELQSLMRITYTVFCLRKKTT